MSFSFRGILGTGDSLKKQVLFYTIVPMIVGICLLSYFSITGITTAGESRIRARPQTQTAAIVI